MPRFRRSRVALCLALAVNAGYVNSACAILAGPVSHVTGHLTATTLVLAPGIVDSLLIDWIVLVSFFFGALVCGCIVAGNTRGFFLEKHDAVALLIETGLLCGGALLFEQSGVSGICKYIAVAFCATACGVQNALTSRMLGPTARTTHVTGVVTDLGMYLGLLFSGRYWNEKRRLYGLAALLTCFFLGGLAGVLATKVLQHHSLWLPAFFTVILAVVRLVIAPPFPRSEPVSTADSSSASSASPTPEADLPTKTSPGDVTRRQSQSPPQLVQQQKQKQKQPRSNFPLCICQCQCGAPPDSPALILPLMRGGGDRKKQKRQPELEDSDDEEAGLSLDELEVQLQHREEAEEAVQSQQTPLGTPTARKKGRRLGQVVQLEHAAFAAEAAVLSASEEEAGEASNGDRSPPSRESSMDV